MNKLLPCLFILFSLNGFSQQLDRLDWDKNFMCSYYGEPLKLEITTYEPAADAETTINKILAMLGLKSNFKVRQALVPNAAAVVYNGKRYILYNPKFFERMKKFTQTDWSSVSILAHEIGHHLNGHTLEAGGSRPDIELEADEFSGFVLRKMGAGLEEAQAAMSIAASQKGSHTHPAKSDRMHAIAAGWRAADDQMTGASASVKSDKEIQKPSENVNKTRVPKSVLAREFVAYDAYFYSDKDASYHVTIKGNLVKVENQEIYIIGRLTNSNRKGFQYMFYDKNFNYLYVSTSGEIKNGSGKKVGYLKAKDA